MRRMTMISAAMIFLAALMGGLYVMDGRDIRMVDNQQEAYDENAQRIVIIARDQGGYMMDEVRKGAEQAASDNDMLLDFTGGYPASEDEVVTQFDIAIASKVDGIIIEGLDQPEFNALVMKASMKGIPVITIHSDAPASLRKTYIGSDHYREGFLMGEHIAETLHHKGIAGVVMSPDHPETDLLREQGLTDAISNYPEMKLVFASQDSLNAQAGTQTSDILNHYPQVEAFVGLGMASGQSIANTSGARSKKGYAIFMFDNSPQTMKLIQDGVVEAGLEQNYEEMGKLSVNLIKRWLDGTELPLDKQYLTTISVITASSEKEEMSP